MENFYVTNRIESKPIQSSPTAETLFIRHLVIIIDVNISRVLVGTQATHPLIHQFFSRCHCILYKNKSKGKRCVLQPRFASQAAASSYVITAFGFTYLFDSHSWSFSQIKVIIMLIHK